MNACVFAAAPDAIGVGIALKLAVSNPPQLAAAVLFCSSPYLVMTLGGGSLWLVHLSLFPVQIELKKLFPLKCLATGNAISSSCILSRAAPNTVLRAATISNQEHGYTPALMHRSHSCL